MRIQCNCAPPGGAWNFAWGRWRPHPGGGDAGAGHLITLDWSRRLDKGRARTVEQTLVAAEVPVMRVPLASDSGT